MMKYIGTVIGAIALMMLIPADAFAGNSASFDVRVSVAAAADVTIVSGTPADFGTMGFGASKASGTAVVIKNTGSGSNQTYSINLTNPSGWTAIATAPGADQYRLSAAFDADGSDITWDPAKHALSTASAAASAAKFAGDQTGAGVQYNTTRNLYFQMETPTVTTSPGTKAIAITITATVD